MLDQAVVTYCICEEISGSLGIEDDLQCRMSTAEVMTFAILAASVFGGDYRRTRLIVQHQRLFKRLLSPSQLVRRIHRVPQDAWMRVFVALRLFLRNKNTTCFIVDSFPIQAYQNHKSFRARIFAGSQYHGYTASKKQYFFGLKVHMVVDIDGVPIEFMLTPGSVSDITALKAMPIGLPENSQLFADKAYTDYSFEDDLSEMEGIQLYAKRKRNLKRQHSCEVEFLLNMQRNRIETVFSSIVSRMPRTIRARTERGFYIKVCLFVLAYMLHRYWPLS